MLADVCYLYYSLNALYQPAFRRFRDDIGLDAIYNQPIAGRDGRPVQL